MNAVRCLIQHHTKKQGAKRSELATKLGYTNISSGLRKMDWVIDNPTIDHSLLLQLQSVLQIPAPAMYLAITQHQEYLEAENRRRFTPYIQTILSSRPSPIFVAGLVPTLWNISVDVALQSSDYEYEINTVINQYQQLQLKHAKNKVVFEYSELVALLNDDDSNNVSYSWVFGCGFKYFRKHDETLMFNRECILQTASNTENPSAAYVTI